MIGHEILRAKIPEFQRQTHVFGLNYHCPDAPNRLQVHLGVLSMGYFDTNKVVRSTIRSTTKPKTIVSFILVVTTKTERVDFTPIPVGFHQVLSFGDYSKQKHPHLPLSNILNHDSFQDFISHN